MPSQTQMALKRIESVGSNKEDRNKVFKELSFVLECYENPNVVKFYGVKFNNESVMNNAKKLIKMNLCSINCLTKGKVLDLHGVDGHLVGKVL